MSTYQTAYAYDPATGLYAGTVQAMQSPRNSDEFGLPANATFAAPPAPVSGKVAVFSAGTWSLLDDLRGTLIYSVVDGSSAQMATVGPIPSGFTALKPATVRDRWNGAAWLSPLTQFDAWNGTGWVTDLDALREYLRATIISQQDAKAQALAASYLQPTFACWPVQITEARAYSGNSAAATPFLDALAAARNMAKADVVSAALAAWNAYQPQLAAVVAEYYTRMAALDAATTAAAMQAA